MILASASLFAHLHPVLQDLSLGFFLSGEDAATPQETAAKISSVNKLCHRLGWLDIERQGERLIQNAKAPESNRDVMEALVDDFREAVISKLSSLRIAIIEDRDKAIYIDATKELCGTTLDASLSAPQEELNYAGKALALGLSTASVYHSMRGVESSLHRLCGRLGIAFPGSAVDLQNWAALEDKIKAEISQLEQTARSPTKTEKLRDLAEVLIPVTGFRLAWRNHVAHARSTYEMEQAREILEHVARYLNALSSLWPQL